MRLKNKVALITGRRIELGDALPMGRVGNVEEVAQAVLFLAGDDSSFMIGVALPVDGGNTAR